MPAERPKLSAEALAQVLRPIQGFSPPMTYPDLLVGLGDPDDAAVWRLDDERALVVTTDFFTPVVDDPYDYGAIAAANALSDVYAMGGKPFLALNIAALPPDLPAEISAEILRGGAEKARRSGRGPGRRAHRPGQRAEIWAGRPRFCPSPRSS